MLRSLANAFRNLVRRDRVDRELDDELHSYVELLADGKAKAGLPDDTAHRAARIEVGGLDQIRESVRNQRTGITLERLVQDVRYGVRMAIRNPTVAVVVVLTLGIGIGATTAVFSVVDAFLLDPLPFPHPDRLVTLSHYDRQAGVAGNRASPANFLDWRDRSRSFSSMAVIEPYGLEIVSDGEPQSLRVWRVSEGFFETLGMRAARGRTFTADEYQPGSGDAIVLGHRFWQQRFAGDHGVVGRTLTSSNRPYTVVGIMPPEFEFPPGRDLWIPGSLTEDDRRNRGGAYHTAIARLKAGVTLDAASAELRSIADQLSQEYPATNRNVGVRWLHCAIGWSDTYVPT
jgi:putative ABC transport system permease protein